MSEKSLVKDAKMLLVEEHFNDDIEDLLWRLRRIERKSMDEISRIISVNGAAVSVEEVATWLGFLMLDEIVAIPLAKPDPAKVPPPPKHKSCGMDRSNKAYDMRKMAGSMCDDSCVIAEDCRYYERYFGKMCFLDVQSKQEFFEPLKNFIDRTYSRDEDMRKIFRGMAEQIATLHQIMQKKIRHMNKKGITVVERKIDPGTGKMVENEIPNPLSGAIIQDAKQITSMLKEMGLTPKSMVNQGAGESDPASLSKALEIEENRRQDMKKIVAIKQERYKQRGAIESKEQLLAMVEEKEKFDASLKRAMNGEDVLDGQDEEEEEAPPVVMQEMDDEATGGEEDKKVLDKPHPRAEQVDIPDEVLDILNRMKKNGGNKDGPLDE